MRSLFKLFTSSLLVLLSTTFTQIGQANAATVETAILFGDLAITKVLGLNANGTTYDVTFSYGHAEEFNWIPTQIPAEPPGDTPDFTEAQATAIVNALLVEFNAINPVYAGGTVAATGDPFAQQEFQIAYAIGGAGTENIRGYRSGGAWLFENLGGCGNVTCGVGPTSARMYAFPVVSEVPLPAAFPLFASGLGVMGLLGWRRKRKKAAAMAAA